METGLIIVIAAVLIFYLRLILLQRQHAKRLKNVPVRARSSKKGQQAAVTAPPDLSIVSPNRRDWWIGGAGLVLILAGVLLRAGAIPLPQEPAWWILTVVGLLPFSFAFR